MLCERDNFKDLVEIGLSVGMSYKEIMGLNPREFWIVYRGKLKYKERELNDTKILNRNLALKMAQAVLDSKEFNKKDNEIRIVKESTEEKAARIANQDGIKPEVIRENILKG